MTPGARLRREEIVFRAKPRFMTASMFMATSRVGAGMRLRLKLNTLKITEDVQSARRWAWPRWVGLVGWFVDWDDSIPFHYVWTDWDCRHCTRLMWKQRLAGWFVCFRTEHGPWWPDHCGKPDHDICARCGDRRDHARRSLRRWFDIEVAVIAALLDDMANRLDAAGRKVRDGG
jgi:hypothetical protein